MSSDERQEAIWDIILQRKFETVPNIADELGVCTRTIYGDVTKMRKKYPIEPISGKYGGVYLVHKPHNAAMHLTPLQEITLQELIFSQPMEIQQVLQSILDSAPYAVMFAQEKSESPKLLYGAVERIYNLPPFAH